MGNRSIISVVVLTLLAGTVAGALWMRSDNSARENYLNGEFERLDQERDSAAQTKQMSDAEFRDYAASVHEQSRIARNVQERLHEQELALAGAENGWIYLLLVAVVVTAIAVALIARSTNERARITIQNALGLPPEQMHDYLVKSQTAETIDLFPATRQPPSRLLPEQNSTRQSRRRIGGGYSTPKEEKYITEKLPHPEDASGDA